MKNRYIQLLLGLIIFSSCIDDFDLPENTFRANFESLWKIVDTRYCYLDTKNIDWDSVYTVYQSRLAADTIDEFVFFDAMAEMLATLKDGHVNLYSGFNRSRYWKWFEDYPANFNAGLIYNDNYLGNNYRVVSGLRYAKIANGDVGYIYYSSFSDAFSDKNMRYIMQYFMDCKGLIIDVRNNGGGSAELSNRLAGYFFQRDTISLYMQHKTGPGHSDFSEPQPMVTNANKDIQWQLPVVVLANRSSYSATNMFVCRMKDAPNALIVGDVTGGGGGLPLSSELPNGWMVRFSSSPMLDGSKQHIEFGIEPDVFVELDSVDVEKGRDTLIDYAVSVISNN
jgi:hypothetical protein